MWSLETYFYITASFFIAGLVKGLVGLGFPTIILAMLSLSLGVRDAMALMLLPCFLTNIWQAFSGANLRVILERIWPLLICASITIWLTTSVIAGLETWLLSFILGTIVCAYALFGMTSRRVTVPEHHEYWLTPILGIVNGVITGLTGTFVVPGVLYLQGLRLPKDALIQAMGILFLVSTTALGAGLFGHGLTSGRFLLFSAAATVPSFVGLGLGQLIRNSLGEQRFERIFYISLFVLGFYIVYNCFF
ncbi:MAG: sulfite exporter TauE/SafE family protein [Desulfocapsaceae bacterium]|nr:sulfite exporter TauE/SafE family protein [Desulfocapsaceae bacterium]